jgi:pyruvate dehydrogenase E2 component (dihydrolipoamide acetyltransferase)
MPLPVILPKFGFTLEQAEIVQWLVKEGQQVRAGDPLCEVTTDKVNMEVEAPEDGQVTGLQYPSGANVAVTAVICYLLRPNEVNAVNQPTPPVAVNNAQPITPLARRIAEAEQIDLAEVRGTGNKGKITRRDVENHAGKVRATPAARRLAHANQIGLETVQGSGPQGRVQGTDIQALLSAKASPTLDEDARLAEAIAILAPKVAPTAAPAPELVTEAAPDVQQVKLEGIRRTIAQRLQKSYQTAPHIFFDSQIDLAAVEGLRSRLKQRGEKLSVTAIIIKACAWALAKHPYLNATLENDLISLHHSAHIGMAVALDDGLIVPVIHNVGRLGLAAVQQQVDALTARARNKALGLAEVQGGTFTISNLGMFGVDRFTAIINPPQVAILAVGRAQRLFVPNADDQPVAKTLLQVTLSADHRVVDGAQAARFLADLRAVLEDPILLAW